MTVRKQPDTDTNLHTPSTVGGGGGVYLGVNFNENMINIQRYMDASNLNNIPIGDYITSS